MRYLLIDRIVEWKMAESIKGIKNVAMSEDYLEFHFPKRPIMPGVLLLEALAQLTGWLEAASSDFTHWWLLTKVHKCNFYGFILPGDQVELEIRCASPASSGSKAYEGLGRVDGKKKIKVSFEGELIALESLEDVADQKRFFQLLTRELRG
jgi:3-hydroxyacyl-[acyl-carrier-protein] dehydratase